MTHRNSLFYAERIPACRIHPLEAAEWAVMWRKTSKTYCYACTEACAKKQDADLSEYGYPVFDSS
jgi:hypothetical protein